MSEVAVHDGDEHSRLEELKLLYTLGELTDSSAGLPGYDEGSFADRVSELPDNFSDDEKRFIASLRQILRAARKRPGDDDYDPDVVTPTHAELTGRRKLQLYEQWRKIAASHPDHGTGFFGNLRDYLQ